MRLRIALALGVTAAALISSAAALLSPAAVAAHGAAPDKRPSCGDPASPDFPITTRLRGGPDTYRAGGAAGEWALELTNTTGESCRNIHPVIVLTDGERELAAEQVELEFNDGTGRWIDVPFDTTDEDEHIGVFDGGFPGFTVAADRTVTVKVRLAFGSGTARARAVANAAVVQRQSDDGEWVGESNDYRFTIAGREAGRDSEPDPDLDPGIGQDPDPDLDPGIGQDPDPDLDPGIGQDPDPDLDPGIGQDPDGDLDPAPDADPGDLLPVPDPVPLPDPDPGTETGDDSTSRIPEPPHALAMTGRDPGPLLALGTTAGALLLGGAALMAWSRHLRGEAARVKRRRS